MSAETSDTENSIDAGGASPDDANDHAHETTVETIEGFGVETCEKCGERAHIGRLSDTCDG